ncbi:acyltransferase family protein [Vibrio rumoiensis]|uniref:acyltransferase family protein n=1 Tax=Vibrio rumoiensis TaxID=76258 RepID=UPI00374A0A00
MKNTEKLALIDGLRGVAFSIVLILHGIALCLDGSIVYLQGTPKYGVWLFFVLSSFLLTKNYVINNKSKCEYFINRVFRILPLYIVSIIVYSIFGIITPSTYDYALSMIGLYGPIHLWTIPVEFSFYFILLFIWFIPENKVKHFVMATIATVSAICLLFIDKYGSSTNVIWYMPSFACGYFLAIIYPRLEACEINGLIPVVIILGLLLISPGSMQLFWGVIPSPYLVNMYFPLSLAMALFILSILNTSSTLIQRMFSSSLLTKLGAISYSGYLIHWLIMILFRGSLGSGWLTVLISIVVSVIIAVICHKYIEMPIYDRRKIILNFINTKYNKISRMF